MTFCLGVATSTWQPRKMTGQWAGFPEAQITASHSFPANNLSMEIGSSIPTITMEKSNPLAALAVPGSVILCHRALQGPGHAGHPFEALQRDRAWGRGGCRCLDLT